MAKLRRAQKHHNPTPSIGDGLGALGSMAGLGGTLVGGSGAADLVSGAAGAGSETQSDDPSVLGMVGGVANIFGGIADMRGMGPVADLMGGIGNGAGVISGVQGALDESRSGVDRGVSGASAVGSYLGLAGAGMTAAVGGEFSLAATLGVPISQIGAGGGALGAGAMASSASAVIGAGVAGYEVGSFANDVGTSDGARSDLLGEDDMTGLSRTPMEWLTDQASDNANDIENQAILDAIEMRRGARVLDRRIDEATGTDWVGDAVGGAVSGLADVGEAAGSLRGHAGGALATVAGAPIAVGAGIGNVAVDAVSDAIGRDRLAAAGRQVRGVTSGLRAAGSTAMSMLFD